MDVYKFFPWWEYLCYFDVVGQEHVAQLLHFVVPERMISADGQMPFTIVYRNEHTLTLVEERTCEILAVFVFCLFLQGYAKTEFGAMSIGVFSCFLFCLGYISLNSPSIN